MRTLTEPIILLTIPLKSAYLCGTCRSIMDGAPKGECRRCGSTAVRTVAELLLSAPERRAWLDQVRGQAKNVS